MIRVTVELIPHGTGLPELLGRATIANISGPGPRADYAVELTDRAGRQWKAGRVRGFPRHRHGAWYLLRRALNELLEERP